MATSYEQMWTQLGLNLQSHDALLSVLGKAYTDIYLAQKNRPQGMAYFDFVMSEVHGLRIQELRNAQQEGRKVIGSFCVFVPEELILALDGVAVGLCAGAEFNFGQAEEYLPRSTCALIKAAFGFKLGKVCPYIEACDLVVGENTCDGKKKAYELLKDMLNKVYIIDLPQQKTEAGRALLRAEYVNFMARLEELTGRTFTVPKLKAAIDLVNAKRQALMRLNRLRAADPAPISGLDALLINQVAFYDDPVRFTGAVNKICDELEERVKAVQGVAPRHTPRLILSGSPMAVPNWKVPWLLETSQGIIVGEESCVGERSTRWMTESNAETLDGLIDKLAARYFQIDCAIFTPNPSRLDHVKDMVSSYHADGVVHYSLQFCQPYQIESLQVERSLEAAGVPVLRLETDYSQEDAGQLRTRIEAFIERIKG